MQICGGDFMAYLEPKQIPSHNDARGTFFPLKNESIETNVVFNKAFVFRGFHAQNPPQQKILSVIEGYIIDIILTVENDKIKYFEYCIIDAGKYVIVPKMIDGLFVYHGYISITESIVSYQVDEPFNPENELNFSWKKFEEEFFKYLIKNCIISEKDNQ